MKSYNINDGVTTGEIQETSKLKGISCLWTKTSAYVMDWLKDLTI